MKRLFLIVFLVSAFFLFLPQPRLDIAFASWGSPGTGPSLWDVSKLLGSGAPNNASKAGFSSIANLFLSLLIIVAILLSLTYLIWGAFDWITSEGNKQKLDQSRQKIIFAIIGLIVVFIAFFVINIIYRFFLGPGVTTILP